MARTEQTEKRKLGIKIPDEASDSIPNTPGKEERDPESPLSASSHDPTDNSMTSEEYQAVN